jgi:hypothetical protein
MISPLSLSAVSTHPVFGSRRVAKKNVMAAVEKNVSTAPVTLFTKTKPRAKKPSKQPKPARFLGRVWRVDTTLATPHPELGKRPIFMVEIPLAERGLYDPLDSSLTLIAEVQADNKGKGRLIDSQFIQHAGDEKPKSLRVTPEHLTQMTIKMLRKMLKRAAEPPTRTHYAPDEIMPTPGYENGNGNGGIHPFTG